MPPPPLPPPPPARPWVELRGGGPVEVPRPAGRAKPPAGPPRAGPPFAAGPSREPFRNGAARGPVRREPSGPNSRRREVPSPPVLADTEAPDFPLIGFRLPPHPPPTAEVLLDSLPVRPVRYTLAPDGAAELCGVQPGLLLPLDAERLRLMSDTRHRKLLQIRDAPAVQPLSALVVVRGLAQAREVCRWGHAHGWYWSVTEIYAQEETWRFGFTVRVTRPSSDGGQGELPSLLDLVQRDIVDPLLATPESPVPLSVAVRAAPNTEHLKDTYTEIWLAFGSDAGKDAVRRAVDAAFPDLVPTGPRGSDWGRIRPARHAGMPQRPGSLKVWEVVLKNGPAGGRARPEPNPAPRALPPPPLPAPPRKSLVLAPSPSRKIEVVHRKLEVVPLPIAAPPRKPAAPPPAPPAKPAGPPAAAAPLPHGWKACRYWAKGHCPFGDRCTYRHPPLSSHSGSLPDPQPAPAPPPPAPAPPPPKLPLQPKHPRLRPPQPDPIPVPPLPSTPGSPASDAATGFPSDVPSVVSWVGTPPRDPSPPSLPARGRARSPSPMPPFPVPDAAEGERVVGAGVVVQGGTIRLVDGGGERKRRRKERRAADEAAVRIPGEPTAAAVKKEDVSDGGSPPPPAALERPAGKKRRVKGEDDIRRGLLPLRDELEVEIEIELPTPPRRKAGEDRTPEPAPRRKLRRRAAVSDTEDGEEPSRPLPALDSEDLPLAARVSEARKRRRSPTPPPEPRPPTPARAPASDIAPLIAQLLTRDAEREAELERGRAELTGTKAELAAAKLELAAMRAEHERWARSLDLERRRFSDERAALDAAHSALDGDRAELEERRAEAERMVHAAAGLHGPGAGSAVALAREREQLDAEVLRLARQHAEARRALRERERELEEERRAFERAVKAEKKERERKMAKREREVVVIKDEEDEVRIKVE